MKTFPLLFLCVACFIENTRSAPIISDQNPVYVLSNTPDTYMLFKGILVGSGLLTITTPTTIKVFVVKRIKTKVDLLWETRSEDNSNGYEIQRKSGNQEWERVAFIFPQIEGPSDAKKLTYEYTDVNTKKEETQYRIRQLRSNRSYRYSEIRTIAGMEYTQ